MEKKGFEAPIGGLKRSRMDSMKRNALSVPDNMHVLEKPKDSSNDSLVSLDGMVDKLNTADKSGRSSSKATRREIQRLGDWVMPARQEKDIGNQYVKLSDISGEPPLTAKVLQHLFELVPILKWLPNYDVKSCLLPDVVVGVTLGLICIVQTLAHAAIATTDIIQGPYCAFVPPFVYAMLGTSRHASISSGAIVAILLADQLAYFEDIEERTHLACLLAFISGSVLVLLALCRAAFLVRFLSESLISGFVTGGSLLIMEGQVKNLCGLHLGHTVGFFGAANEIILHLHESNIVGVCLGLLLLVLLNLMVDLKKYANKRLKGKGPHSCWLRLAKFLSEMKEIVCVIIGISFAYLTMDEEGNALIPIVGHIPQGLPTFVPSWDHRSTADLLNRSPLRLREFFTAGCLLALTSFLTTYATAKKQASNHDYKIDATQEAFALGVAGIAGSFFGAFTCSGSLSRTSLASEVGVKTQLNGAVLAVVVGCGLTYLTPVLYYLPKATLAAIVLKSAWGLRDFDTASQLWAQWKPHREGGQQRDFCVWCVAFTFTVSFGALYGIGCSVVVGLLMIIGDAATPSTVVLGCMQANGSVWRDIEVWPEGTIYEGVMVVEFRGPLNYASAEWFHEQLECKRELHNSKAQEPAKVIVLGFGSTHDLDPTALVMFREVLTTWRKLGITCIIADAKSRVRLLLEKNFATGKARLLTQPAFLITITDAVDLALRLLAKQGVCQDEEDLHDKRPTGRFAGRLKSTIL